MRKDRVGFIGGGQMATALLAGAIQSRVLSAEQATVIEPSAAQRKRLAEQFAGLRIGENPCEAAECQRVVLAVKPQVLRQIGSHLARQLPGDRLWISIAAGVNLAELGRMLATERLIRIMPNTPAQVGAGAAGISAGPGATEEDISWVEALMNAVGISCRVPESLLHAVTGIAGSSPAYLYLIIEALSDAGVAGGLPRQEATRLAAQAVLGAARMVLQTGLHPGQLKDQVTSPAGTTIEALRVLETSAVRGAILEAVAACIRRSKELERDDTR